jgi:PIN like domain
MNIYLDENLSEYVADALNSLCKGHFRDIEVFSTKRAFGKGVLDEDLIPQIGEQMGILITRDVAIHRTRSQYELCKSYNLGIWFLPQTQVSHWQLVKLLISHWDEIVETSQKAKRPFAYKLKMKGKPEKM